jgi:hypothetical protein
MRTLLPTACAAVILALTAGSAGAGQYRCGHDRRPYHPPPPASDFSAYYYHSPGGLGRVRRAQRVYGYTHPSAVVPYPQSCGTVRSWNGRRCVASAR